jgi:hypothetical protein
MSSVSKAVLLASAAGLAAGLQVTTQANEIIQAAIDKLEGMWPQKGKQVLEDIFGLHPPYDDGRALQERLLVKFHEKKTFVFAAFGSSVSAGHDNFMNQSWTFELERLLKPTFKDLGFDFEMRQRAAGGYGEMPFGAGCLNSRAGEGVDALSWEWHYFYDDPCEGHHFLSEAADMKSSPMVFAFADSNVPFDNILQHQRGEPFEREGVEGREGCGDVRREARDATMARKDEDTWNFDRDRVWKPNEWYLTEEFITNAEVDKFSRAMKSSQCDKLQEKPDDRIPWNKVWLQMTGVAPAFEKAGHAFYPISVGAGSQQLVQLPWYQAREKAFKVNWHPGPLGHTLIASSIAHFFLANLTSALGVGPPQRHKGPSHDNPLVGKPIVGQLEEPKCGSLRVNQCKTGMFPTSKGTDLRGSRASDRSDDTWEYTISRQAAERGVEAVDKRWVYRGNKTSGELKLNIVAPKDGMYVVLCGAPCGWRCEGKAGYVSSMSQRWWPEEGTRKSVSDLKFSIDGNGVRDNDLPKLHDKLFGQEAGIFCPGCDNPASLCQPVAKVDAGQHTVGVRVEPHTWEGADGEDTFVEIMQLMVVG